MTLKALEHFLVVAKDLEATKDFYCDVLGLKAGFRPAFDFPGYWLYLGNDAVIHLAGAGDNPQQRYYLGEKSHSGDPGPLDHIAFNCEGYDQMVADFERRKMPMRCNKVPNMELYQIFVQDPNGVTLELNFRLEGKAKKPAMAGAAERV